MSAAKYLIVRFNTVSDNARSAVSAVWSQLIDGALKAIEDVLLSRHNHRKSFIIGITAIFTLIHKLSHPFGFKSYQGRAASTACFFSKPTIGTQNGLLCGNPVPFACFTKTI